jgi:OmcA/MtrC family decaheme c-type cytochrome
MASANLARACAREEQAVAIRTWRRIAWLAALAATAVIATACGDDDNDDGGGGPIELGPVNLEIQSANVPESGRPTVTFRVTDASGNPIDVAAEVQNSINSPATFPNTVPRFTLAQLGVDGNYTSYYATTANPREGWTAPGPLDDHLTPGPATQATTQPPTNPYPVADLRAVGNGVYELTLPETNVTGLDRARTHTLAGWVARTMAAGAEPEIGHGSLNFIPAGAGTVERDEVVSDAACNVCHGAVQAHGTRRGIQLCITCHSPQTTDPETGRTVDFKSMIHKIHAGADLPSNLQGFPYYIVGFGNPVPAVHDYSHVVFPRTGGVAECTACHQGEDADNWRSRPSAEACTSCHDNVKFDGSASRACGADLTAGENAFDDCDHPTIPRADDPTLCATCHQPGAIADYHGVIVP